MIDNTQTHRASVGGKRSEELGVRDIFLSQYSPELRPMEFAWKYIKKELSGMLKFEGWHTRPDQSQ